MEIKEININNFNHVVPLFDQYRVFYKRASNIATAKSFLNDRLKNEESKIFAAFNGKKAEGFVQLYPSFSSVNLYKSWILNDLFVITEARKKGIAQSLLNRVIEFSKKDGAKTISLETSKVNYLAKKLYAKNGFIHKSIRSKYDLFIYKV
ncbi:MAG: GNAT family N-acetyltransferase [Flavobacteriaceae bacterium]|nr:GNAT family N-acetyltransferase [Flavobacteriaceae bacterium]